jgi:predicted methyltransferase
MASTRRARDTMREETTMYDKAALSELLRFAEVREGSTVVDVYPGAGDWTRLFAGTVGPEGRVVSFVPTEIADIKPDQANDVEKMAAAEGLDNVHVASADLVALSDAADVADLVFVHLFYHDFHTALIQRRGATPSAFNKAVLDLLRPGGSYVIVDHAAAAGTWTSDSPSLHRIDPAAVRAEVEAAGFMLAAETSILANSDDPHTAKVFDASIKGSTDRFAYRFVKP